MATRKSYAYQIKGNKISLLENQFGYGSGQDVITVDGSSINHKQYTLDEIGPTGKPSWVSPTVNVADGIEIEYVYSPNYFIDETDKVDTQIDTYVSTDGLLKLIDQGDNDYSASPESLSDGSYIVLKNAGKWNGLHKVKAAGTGYITLYTKCSDSSTVQQAFEKTPDLYYNVSALVDESSELDLPSYLSKSLVYYLKAKQAEENLDIEKKEYFMWEFKRIVEKHESSKISGPRRIMGFGMTR